MNEQKNENMNFQNLGIADKLLETIAKMGLTEPTPIQLKTIPAAIEGKDLVGIAQTGTGKTLAFAVPMIQRLALYKGKGLVLLPTRELAAQVDEHLRAFGASLGLRTAVLIGGESINRQREMVRRNPHILIATPGRMNDFIQRGWIKLDEVKILILDEADMMLDMGFAPQIETIIKKIPKERQTMLFSATMPDEIFKLAANHMAEPIRVEVAPSGQTAEGINQEIFIIHKEARVAQLEKLLRESAGSVLIFCRTKRGVSKLTEQVEMMGHRAAEIHSNRSLEQRRKALAGFKARKYRVLVATDIAARGLDVKDIELVINFDLPEDPGDYVHRVGRTGRAGKTGKAISFASPDQIRDVRQIERLIKKVLPLTKLAEFREAGGTGSSALRRRPARNFPRPFNKSGRHFAYQGAKKSGPSKFNGAASRPAGGFGKFKAKDVGFRSASGSGKFKPNRVAKGGFDPLRYFSNRPETRIMTDKERFRASLRDNDRPSFGRGKSRAGGNRPGRGFRR